MFYGLSNTHGKQLLYWWAWYGTQSGAVLKTIKVISHLQNQCGDGDGGALLCSRLLFATPHWLQLTRLLCPWDFPGQEHWSGWPFSPPGGLPSLGIKTVCPALEEGSLPLSHLGSPRPMRKLLSRVQLFVTPWTIQSIDFSRPGYWSG